MKRVLVVRTIKTLLVAAYRMIRIHSNTGQRYLLQPYSNIPFKGSMKLIFTCVIGAILSQSYGNDRITPMTQYLYTWERWTSQAPVMTLISTNQIPSGLIKAHLFNKNPTILKCFNILHFKRCFATRKEVNLQSRQKQNIDFCWPEYSKLKGAKMESRTWHFLPFL